MTKIIFGINVPYKSTTIDWKATDAKAREKYQPSGFHPIRIPCIRIHKELSFELCDICGNQVPPGRVSRGITTCCPEHNQRKWDAKNGLIIEKERNMVGERPYHFWQTISLECFQRDNFTCTKCHKTSKELREDRDKERNQPGYSYSDYSLCCHHVKRIVDGGNNKLENLLTRCGKCHKLDHSHEMNKARKCHVVFGAF